MTLTDQPALDTARAAATYPWVAAADRHTQRVAFEWNKLLGSIGDRLDLEALQRLATAMDPPTAAAYAIEPINKFNPNHDEKGRFSSGAGYVRTSGQLYPVIPGGEVKNPGVPIDVSMHGLDAKTRKASVATWERTSGISVEEGRRNLQAVFDEATGDSAAMEYGRHWYQDAHDHSAELAKQYGVSIDVAAGVVAGLSPGARWEMNKTMAEAILDSSKRHPELDPERLAHVAKAEHNLPIPHGYDPLIKAARMAKGEPPGKVLLGAKVRSFYNNIRDPSDPRHITIDTHMLDAMYGGTRKGAAGIFVEVPKNKLTDYMTKKGYDPANQIPKDWKARTPSGVDWVARNPVFSGLTGSPKSGGRSIGALPVAADAVRDITHRWNRAHPDDRLVPHQVQAIIWDHWIRVHPPIESRQATDAAIAATGDYYGKRR